VKDEKEGSREMQGKTSDHTAGLTYVKEEREGRIW